MSGPPPRFWLLLLAIAAVLAPRCAGEKTAHVADEGSGALRVLAERLEIDGATTARRDTTSAETAVVVVTGPRGKGSHPVSPLSGRFYVDMRTRVDDAPPASLAGIDLVTTRPVWAERTREYGRDALLSFQGTLVTVYTRDKAPLTADVAAYASAFLRKHVDENCAERLRDFVTVERMIQVPGSMVFHRGAVPRKARSEDEETLGFYQVQMDHVERTCTVYRQPSSFASWWTGAENVVFLTQQWLAAKFTPGSAEIDLVLGEALGHSDGTSASWTVRVRPVADDEGNVPLRAVDMRKIHRELAVTMSGRHERTYTMTPAAGRTQVQDVQGTHEAIAARPPRVALQWELVPGSGMHRRVRYRVSGVPEKCDFRVFQRMPTSLFVDPYEVPWIKQVVEPNLERPEPLSPGNAFFVTDRTEFELPMHMRYGAVDASPFSEAVASNGEAAAVYGELGTRLAGSSVWNIFGQQHVGSLAPIALPRPFVQLSCDRKSGIPAPLRRWPFDLSPVNKFVQQPDMVRHDSDYLLYSSPSWVAVTLVEGDDGTPVPPRTLNMHVPVGMAAHFYLVQIGTLLVAGLGTAYLVSVITRAPTSYDH